MRKLGVIRIYIDIQVVFRSALGLTAFLFKLPWLTFPQPLLCRMFLPQPRLYLTQREESRLRSVVSMAGQRSPCKYSTTRRDVESENNVVRSQLGELRSALQNSEPDALIDTGEERTEERMREKIEKGFKEQFNNLQNLLSEQQPECLTEN